MSEEENLEPEVPEVPEEEEEEIDDGYEYVYGVAMPQLPPGLQPLEIIVLIEGIMMDTGQPTITAMGSEGMKPWTGVGLLRMEAARLEQGYVYGGNDGFDLEDEEEDEDEDG